MSEWKKAAVGVLVSVIILQLAVLCTAAAGAGADGHSGDRKTVLIDLFANAGEISDFVTEFPEALYRSEVPAELPVELLAAVSAKRKVYDEIPGYVQEDYVHALYGDGTVASCGSSITALAMAATYLTGYQYLPDELARSFAGKADTDMERIRIAGGALGLVCAETDKWEDIFSALQEGRCAILQLNENSLFAEAWHFIVVKGITEDGRILVQDPCKANYEKEALKEGYASGFDADFLSQMMSRGLIPDRPDAPEELARYAETAPGEGGDRYDHLELTLAEQQLLARAACVLGRGECVEGQQAIAEVLLNRLLAEEYPDELRELVYGRNALCSTEELNEIEMTETEYAIVTRALYGPYLLETNVTELTYECHR